MRRLERLGAVRGVLLAVALGACAAAPAALAFDWQKLLEGLGGSKDAGTASVQALSDSEVAAALREALAQGAERAIAALGRPDGFLGNAAVRIPLPPELEPAARALRGLGQQRYVDDFVRTMNRAAETAVGEASAIMGDAVRSLTVADAKQILTGPDDAATQYFRRVGEPRLETRLRPVVADATARTGVTNAYKQFMNRAGFAAQLLGADTVDLDGYITDRALDGLFLMIAREEQRIRKDPVARSTELLEKVFGATRG